MLEQAPAETLGWLAGEARSWQQRHASRAPGDPVPQWWSQRAGQTAQVLATAAASAGGAVTGAALAGAAC
ncbi:MAG: hypothetical protein ACM32E_24770 [Gemmatimonadota bacterium]